MSRTPNKPATEPFTLLKSSGRYHRSQFRSFNPHLIRLLNTVGTLSFRVTWLYLPVLFITSWLRICDVVNILGSQEFHCSVREQSRQLNLWSTEQRTCTQTQPMWLWRWGINGSKTSLHPRLRLSWESMLEYEKSKSFYKTLISLY